MSKYFIAIAALIFANISGCESKAEITPAKRELAATVLHESGVDRTILRSGAAIIAAWKKSRTDVPAAFWENKTKDIEAAYGKGLLDAHITTFANEFSEKDLQDLINFYRSPTGRKFFDFSERTMPKLMQEAASLQSEFNVSVQKRLAEHGYQP